MTIHRNHGTNAGPVGMLREWGTRGVSLAALIYMAMLAVYAVFDPDALDVSSVMNLANNSAPLALAAAGQTVVILSRGFDLSLAGTIAVANVLVATYPLPGPGGAVASFLLCAVVGAAVGLVNGYLVAYRRIQPIAATLATMIVTQGIALLIMPVPGGSVADFISMTMTDTLFGMPITAMVVCVFAALWLFLKHTDVGVWIYATGADEVAATLSGVPTRRARCLAFVVAGVCYGASGFLLSAQTATGDPNSGIPFLLLSFAAVALGGTSLTGGQGGVIGSMIGAGVLLLMQKMLLAMGISSFYTGLCQGLLLIAAILCERGLTQARHSGAEA
ncbi:ABC transporter permease [Caballeronia sp. LZ001]|uniref:ABC transporter permease n=1 Tax=Caballeronia sp. LZ001 TaxID=3038553 RepID=UPI002856C0B7|nr:ABC transporter permease [Caballeronia sp. LZ001]MDR5804792.1 ABC transporter permease [Caballeronia sp. LZ001]